MSKNAKDRILHPCRQEGRSAARHPVYVGDRAGQPIRITRIVYDAQTLDEQTIERVDDCFTQPPPSGVVLAEHRRHPRRDAREQIGKRSACIR